MTLGKWADNWYQNYKSEVQAFTYSGYRYTLNIIKNGMGTEVLHKVLPERIDTFLDTLIEADYSLSQIKTCRTGLYQHWKTNSETSTATRLYAGCSGRIDKSFSILFKSYRACKQKAGLESLVRIAEALEVSLD